MIKQWQKAFYIIKDHYFALIGVKRHFLFIKIFLIGPVVPEIKTVLQSKDLFALNRLEILVGFPFV